VIFSATRTRVIVWDEHRLVYLRVPKNANSAIRGAIPGAVQHRLDIRKLAKKFPGHLSFSFVRNPWARLVSAYANKIHPEPINEKNFVNGVHRNYLELGIPVRAGMPFAEFAEVACSLSDEKTEKHIRSQCYYLVRDGRVVPEFVGRLENVAEDWPRLCARAGVEAKLAHTGKSRHAPYTDYYPDARIRNLVGDRYREDVETFGYEFWS
jgi:dermatan 4-sulfotransferase 1